MAEARDLSQWNHTFAICAQLYNSHRNEKAEAIDVRRFCPHLRDDTDKSPPPPTEEERAMLRAAFPGKKRG
jgi:hypothetical protein